LGHGDEEYKAAPTVVEGLRDVKAVHLSTGEYTTFVVAENGDVYSFGSGESLNLIFQVCSFFLVIFEKYIHNIMFVMQSAVMFHVHQSFDILDFCSQEDDEGEEEGPDFSTPTIVESLKALNKKVAQVCPTNASYWLNSEMGHPHTFAVMESGEVCAFGGGIRGQLGVKLGEGVEKASVPVHVPIDLS
jgi:alpha-tubulin suppressor-like RCC1 family protein